MLPVHLSYRLVPVDGGPTIEGPHTRLPRSIRRRDVLATVVQIDWPAKAGSYEVAIDLVVENLDWFEARLGEPLVRAIVIVEPSEKTMLVEPNER